MARASTRCVGGRGHGRLEKEAVEAFDQVVSVEERMKGEPMLVCWLC